MSARATSGRREQTRRGGWIGASLYTHSLTGSASTDCRRETRNDARATRCWNCDGEKEQLRADSEGREAARRGQRAKEYAGRSLNALGAGTSLVPRAAQGVFERARVDVLVHWETQQLEQYTGAASYLRKEESMLGVMESYYVVHTGARVSVFDEEKRAHMTGTDVARFFNAIGRKAAVGVPGETTRFPWAATSMSSGVKA
mmetsp:Transcript_44246/g.142205  ORF Transcript_44246/g.142205 Transcript_44246/m.142205 type:complete len:201 (-) Transcript_44246:325-927(-)